MAEPQLVTITINDVELQVPKGELIVESVKRLGLELPIFCYHPRMKPVGMCRMCFVEVGFKGPDGTIKKMPKPQAGCTLPASEGMAIFTDTEQVHKDRKGILEFLLINHPLDCPVCDRGGECPLQNNTLFYGPSTSRFVEIKRHLPKAFPLSKYITLDLERCIQCGRCVRFTEEISGDAQLALLFRGASMQPHTFEMTDFTSKFSGNVIEICPVGALTNSHYRFRARPWDLETKPAICTRCSNGCSVWFDYRGEKMVRINGRTHEDVNEEWTCDRGKFGHEFYNSSKRLTHPLIRRGDTLVQAGWAEAFDEIRRAIEGKELALIGGAENSNEDLFMAKRVLKNQFDCDNVDHRFETHLPSGSVEFAQKAIASYEHEPVIFLFGRNLAEEEPILFLRIRKAWLKYGARVIVASSEPTDADVFADVVLRYKAGEEAALIQSLTGNAKADAKVEAARQALKGGAVPIVATRSLYNLPDGAGVVQALTGLGSLSVYGLRANDQGAEELGFNSGIGTHASLRKAESGELEALWLLGDDPFASHPDRGLVQRALEAVPFLIVQAHSETEAFHYASVVLPMTAPAEMEGTYTNLERRVQRLSPVLPTRGEAKPAWRAFTELALRVSGERPFFNAAEVMSEIARFHPQFSAIEDYDALGTVGGVLLAATRETAAPKA